MTEASTFTIASGGLSADISTLGAELQSLRDARGRQLLWDGDPAVWAGRAPILFPIIGMLAGGRYRLDGVSYAMPKHGIARHALFDVVMHDDNAMVLRLLPDAQTRAAYPFAFRLDIAFTVTDALLRIVATIANHDARPLPASFGFHPALRWPLPFDRPRADHRIRFEHDEAAAIRRIDSGGLLTAEAHPTPVVGNVLMLRDALFDDDALIFDAITSRRVSYGAAEGPRLDIGFEDFPTLGVWTKPGGAGFICIEPWQGSSDPVGFDGEIYDKPGIVVIAAGESRSFTMTIALNGIPMGGEPR
ncbi:MAG: aldose 1-epimerase family protein [Burkholderiaceae bacterium]